MSVATEWAVGHDHLVSCFHPPDGSRQCSDCRAHNRALWIKTGTDQPVPECWAA